MKLTKTKLKQIIKEELEEVAGVGLSDMTADPDFKGREAAPGRDVRRETKKYEIAKTDRGFVAEMRCDEIDYGGHCPDILFKDYTDLRDLDDDTLDMILDHAISMKIKS